MASKIAFDFSKKSVPRTHLLRNVRFVINPASKPLQSCRSGVTVLPLSLVGTSTMQDVFPCTRVSRIERLRTRRVLFDEAVRWKRRIAPPFSKYSEGGFMSLHYAIKVN